MNIKITKEDLKELIEILFELVSLGLMLGGVAIVASVGGGGKISAQEMLFWTLIGVGLPLGGAVFLLLIALLEARYGEKVWVVIISLSILLPLLRQFLFS